MESHGGKYGQVAMNTSKLISHVREQVDRELRILCVEARECASLGAALTEKERKALLIFRDGLRCQGCGWKPPYEDHLEVDHMEPRSLGGTDEIENRELLCGPCNKLKSNKLTLTELQEQRIEDGSMDMDWWMNIHGRGTSIPVTSHSGTLTFPNLPSLSVSAA